MELMRVPWPWVGVAGGVAAVAAWLMGVFAGLRPLAVSLASQPDVAEAFNDPVSARTDALLVLVSVVLLSPVVLGVIAGVVTFAVIVTLLVTGPVVRPLQLPPWICVPLVLLALGYGVWAARGQWGAPLRYAGGLAAKAGLVFFAVPDTPR
jgi:hypothetical protein